MTEYYDRFDVFDVMAFQELSLSHIMRWMGWGRRKLESVATRKTRISFGDREKLAEGLGVRLPEMLNVKLSEYEPEDEYQKEDTEGTADEAA